MTIARDFSFGSRASEAIPHLEFVLDLRPSSNHPRLHFCLFRRGVDYGERVQVGGETRAMAD